MMSLLAIPIKEDNDFDSNVNMHFSRSPFFFIYNTTSKSGNIVKNTAANKPGHEGPLEILNGLGVTKILCSGIGSGAIDFAKELGITVCFGRTKTVSELIERYKNGELENILDGSACRE